MNDFESTLTAALQAEADKTTQAVDTMPAAQRLESRLDAIDRGRRRRTWVTVIAVGAVAVVAVAVVLAGRQTLRSAPLEPIQPPAPTIPGGEVVAADPFLPSWHLSLWDIVRQQAAEPAQLTNCVDPRDWNAVDSRWATYADPANPSIRVNEFVLQTPTSPARTVPSSTRGIRSGTARNQPTPEMMAASPSYPPGSGALAARYDEGLGSPADVARHSRKLRAAVQRVRLPRGPRRQRARRGRGQRIPYGPEPTHPHGRR